MYEIQVPNRLTFETASKFGCDLLNMPLDHDEFMLDFGRVGRVEPFALLYLGSELQRFNQRIGERNLYVRNHDHMSYADHMGFFRSFGVEGQKNKKLAAVADTYL